jgi:hypothetical protein
MRVKTLVSFKSRSISSREMVAPPSVADARTATPPLVADAGAQGSVGDIGASTSPPVIDVDPINAVLRASDQDLVGDPIKIE